ncbi:hypothetical protein QEP21_12580 [Pseudomonas shirazica]|nr:hypothetical protein [Pseudomonas shirazica]MDH4431170.1 hypothetical protein [Pseudomonas shirazica]
MTPDKLGVDQQVFEYAQHGCAPFDSAHGFHSRWLRRFALRGYLVNAINRHKLENGVLAVVLDDTVGLIQEYNHQRLNWVVKRQAWLKNRCAPISCKPRRSCRSFAPRTGNGRRRRCRRWNR